MKVSLAKKTGFCFGVKRAVDMAEVALEDNSSIASLGSIIHNEQVVRDLSKKGLKVVKDIDDVKADAVVISSHGISPVVTKRILGRGIKPIDTTCPFVLKAQNIAKAMSNASYNVIIVGDADHPEVKALVDFVSTRVYVAKDKKEAKALKLHPGERFVIISQTTQATNNFLDVVKAVSEKNPKEIKIFNTICKDAEERQKAARVIASSVDLMLVIGGKHSANTRRLFKVCKSILSNTRFVQTEKDLKRSWFKGASSVGITSGASTPDWIVKKVSSKVKQMTKQNKKRKGLDC